MNAVTIMGRIGSKDLVEFEQGSLLNVSVATDESYYDKNKEKVEKTEWHRVVFHNKAAETVNKFFSVGERILLQGKLETQIWEDKNGSKRSTTRINALRFEFVESKKDSMVGSKAEPRQSKGAEDDKSDDLPF